MSALALAGAMVLSCSKDGNEPRALNDRAGEQVAPETLQADSLVLVDIYNEAGGDGWFNRTGWLEPIPVRDWAGVVVETVDGKGRVVELNLGYNNLKGQLSKSIGKLSALRKLRIGYNRHLRGALPEELYDLRQLEVLFTTQSAFTGELSPKIAQLQRLDTLILRTSPWVLDASSYTRNPDVMTGQLPKEIGQLKNLRYLDLGRQGFSGEIPAELADLQSLNYLNLETCRFTGRIPAALGRLRVERLDLSHNQLEGEIPADLFRLSNVRYLDLSCNKLTGAIPETVEHLERVGALYMDSNQLSGRVPEGLGKLAYLTIVFLGNNKLEGPLPSNFAGEGNKALSYVDLHNNNLTGSLPLPMKHHRFYNSPYVTDWQTMSSYVEYYAEGNRFTGPLQSEYMTDKKRWHIYTPQQPGYGFDNLTDEQAEQYRPRDPYNPDRIHVPTDVD